MVLLGDIWLSVGGCSLHIHNLAFQCPYEAVFGPADLEKPSVLMLVRTIKWLQKGNFAIEQHLALKLGIKISATKITEAVLTRWRTLSDALEWLDENGVAYGELCEAMCNGLSSGKSKTRQLYATVGKWIRDSPKLTADCAFVRCFCNTIWTKRYHYLVQTDAKSGRSGFVSHRLTRFYFDYDKDLSDCMGGKWKTNAGFEPFHRLLASIPDEQVDGGDGKFLSLRMLMEKQADEFFAGALSKVRSHSPRWRRDVGYTAIGDSTGVGVAVAAVFVAMHEALYSPLPGATLSPSPPLPRPVYTLTCVKTATRLGETKKVWKPFTVNMTPSELVARKTAVDTARTDALAKLVGKSTKVGEKEYDLAALASFATVETGVHELLNWESTRNEGPVPFEALQRWVALEGRLESRRTDRLEDVGAMATVLTFLRAECWGQPSNQQVVERNMKDLGRLYGGKPTLSDEKGSALHMVANNGQVQDKKDVFDQIEEEKKAKKEAKKEEENEAKRARREEGKERSSDSDSSSSSEEEEEEVVEKTGFVRRSRKWTKLALQMVLQKLCVERIPNAEQMALAKENFVKSETEMDRTVAEVDLMLATIAGQKERETTGKKRGARKLYADYKDVKKVPEPAAGVVGKVKPTKLKMLAQVEAGLRRCGIAIPDRLIVGAGIGAISETDAARARTLRGLFKDKNCLDEHGYIVFTIMPEEGDVEADMLEAYARTAVEISGDSAEAGAGFMEEVERANEE